MRQTEQRDHLEMVSQPVPLNSECTMQIESVTLVHIAQLECTGKAAWPTVQIEQIVAVQ